MTDETPLLKLIETRREAILGAVNKAGYPHLTNVLYVWDAEERVARITTTADRVKGKILTRNPKAALHVSGENFWQYAVAEGDVDSTAAAATAGDEALTELKLVHGILDPREESDEEFNGRMIEDKRLVLRLHATRIYGVVIENPPG